ncbi:hypothetical protein B0H11DRAFT_2275381 [Mycena galericulata]|nr:hypothetical protein B0H11DRAFT_2275381 [Mycena galericulata]
MAVIVEVPEQPEIAGNTKGKGVGAGERSAGFAAYLRQMHVNQEAGTSKSAKNFLRKKSHGKGSAGTKKKAEKGKFSRPDSQVPEGGWFRNTTGKSGSPPAPLNSPVVPSDFGDSSPSSDSSSSSSDTESDSSSSDSSSSSSSGRKRHKKAPSRLAKDKSKLKEMKNMKKAMAGIKIKPPPFVWDGKPGMDIFDQWTFEVDNWIELTALSDKLAMKLIVNFMSGTASKFFMDHVSTEPKKWTVKDVYRALLDYCFPADFNFGCGSD